MKVISGTEGMRLYVNGVGFWGCLDIHYLISDWSMIEISAGSFLLRAIGMSGCLAK